MENVMPAVPVMMSAAVLKRELTPRSRLRRVDGDTTYPTSRRALIAFFITFP
jgi:hypothetical protein